MMPLVLCAGIVTGFGGRAHTFDGIELVQGALEEAYGKGEVNLVQHCKLSLSDKAWRMDKANCSNYFHDMPFFTRKISVANRIGNCQTS